MKTIIYFQRLTGVQWPELGAWFVHRIMMFVDVFEKLASDEGGELNGSCHLFRKC